VATAFVVAVDGSRVRKLLWLLTGAALVWVLNVARIIIIFWSAQRWGEDVAIDGFHPYTGLVVFNVGVVLMVLVMRLFGLRFRSTSPVEHAARSARWFGGGTFRQPTLMSLTIVGLMATAVGVFNADLRNYDRIASSFGAPRLSSFAESRETPDGWQLTDSAQYDWTKRFFGSSSTWRRYSYASLQDNSSELRSNAILIADVIETDDRAALDAYGVEACYSFHNYKVGGQQSVDLGSGLVGSMLTWTDPKSSLTYTTLFWHWPIATPSGTRYERVTLLLQDQTSNQFRSPALESDLSRQLQLDINDLLRGADSQVARDRQLETRRFMIGFATQMVALRQPADTSDG